MPAKRTAFTVVAISGTSLPSVSFLTDPLVTFHAKLLSNDSIGNDWSTTYTHNEKTIQSGYTILSPLGVFTFQTIAVEIRENDKLDDIGSGVLHVGICDGGSGDVQITVVENGGKYNGNTALWEITCSVKLIGKQ